MKKLITLFLLFTACCSFLIASDATKVGMKVYQNGGSVLDCGVVDSVKFTTEEVSSLKESDYVVDGALVKVSYKVSDSKRVYFSQGNLQFNAVRGTHAVYGSTTEKPGTWRFAENQYDYIGDSNKNISQFYNGWIDLYLFGWGTSGWNSGRKAYQPWATSEVNSDYLHGDLTGSLAVAD